MPEYTITIADLIAYLARFGPDEEVGFTQNAHSCLVALALDKKYGMEVFIVDGERFSTTDETMEGWVDLPEDVEKIIDQFDEIGRRMPVSRRQVEDAIPALKGEHANG